MATIPSGTKFIGLPSTYPTAEKRSSLVNAESGVYTMQDIADTVAIINPGLPSFLEYDNTNKTFWNNGQGNIVSNTTFGQGALQSVTSANYSSAFGESALQNLTTGDGNTAFGCAAGFNMQTGIENAFFGRSAGVNQVNGSYNTAIGVRSLLIGNTGNQNTAIGHQSLASNTGNDNTAVGQNSLYLNTTGSGNSCLGTTSLFSLTTGSNNIGIGSLSASTLSTGAGNVIIGRQADVFSGGTNFSIAIGQESRAESYSIAIGTQATSGGYSYCVVMGSAATATANNQFVVGSTTQAVGAVTTETVTSTRTWSVVINGVSHKILLA